MVRPWRVPEKKGQDSQKSHKGVIFHLFGENLHWTDLNQNLYSSFRLGRNHVCKVLN